MPTTEEIRSFGPVATDTNQKLNLAMQRLFLMGQILPIGARLIVQHTFQCEGTKPLELIYTFPLPRDAALRRFRVSGKGFSVRSQLKPVDEAIKIYEQGIEGGHLSTLVRQYADGLVSLTLGNIRPGELVTVNLEMLTGVEIHDDGIRFRFPFTLSPSYHSKAKAVAIDPGIGELELPEEEFGDLILPQFKADASSLHQIGFDLSIHFPQPFKEISSPSHALRVAMPAQQRARVSLAPESDLPNRDLVLEVNAQESLFGTTTGIAKDGKGHFALIVPSSRFGPQETRNPRRIVFVLDRSGSMEGLPIQQAAKAIEACLGSLSEQDSFGLVAFDDKVEVFKRALVPATMEHRRAAGAFLKQIKARGGTELAQGFLKAAELLGAMGGDALIVTDGQVSGTQSILERAGASGIRIHCLGIGSASQDRFLALLARQSGGVSRFLTPRERVDLSAVDLFASIGHPVAQQLQIETGSLPNTTLAPEPPSTVFSGNPLVIFGETGAREGKILLRWQADEQARTLECPLSFEEGRIGDTVRLIRGARLITDIESRFDESEARPAVKRRTEDRIDNRLELLSETFGLASRRMALVAVLERESDRPGVLPEIRVVPVGMPQDVSFDSYFGARQKMACFSMVPSSFPMPSKVLGDLKFLTLDAVSEETSPGVQYMTNGTEDFLLSLASEIESDGGMPGKNIEERVLSSILALLCFLEKGHNPKDGTFRAHVQRLISFLESKLVRSLSSEQQMSLERIIKHARSGRTLRGDWNRLAAKPLKGHSKKELWTTIDAALQGIDDV